MHRDLAARAVRRRRVAARARRACSPADGRSPSIVAPSTASKRAAPATTMFSPSLPTSSTRSSSSARRRVRAARPRPPRAPSWRTPGTRRCSRPARSRSRRRPSCPACRRRRCGSRPCPSVVSRPARFAALAMPRSRRSLTRALHVAVGLASARLQSIIPAPVWSRSSLTRLPRMTASLRTPPRSLASAAGSPFGAAGSASAAARPRLRLGLGCGLFRRRRPRLLGAALGARSQARSPAASRLLLPCLDAVGDHARDQVARADRVVVARDRRSRPRPGRSSCRRAR